MPPVQQPIAISPQVEAAERRIRMAKTIVLSLACVVGMTLITAVVFGIYNYTTERPAKELFGLH